MDLKPDYNKTTYEVYKHSALQSLRQYQSLEVLCYAWQSAHLVTSWPSWIPRWDIPTNLSGPSFPPFLYDAAKNCHLECHYDPIADSLTVRGVCLGPIVKRTSTLRYRVMGDSKTKDKSRITKEALLTLVEIITQDRWQPDTSDEAIATRARDNLDTQLSSMACLVHITGWGG
jgi:hypothetical protein